MVLHAIPFHFVFCSLLLYLFSFVFCSFLFYLFSLFSSPFLSFQLWSSPLLIIVIASFIHCQLLVQSISSPRSITIVPFDHCYLLSHSSATMSQRVRFSEFNICLTQTFSSLFTILIQIHAPKPLHYRDQDSFLGRVSL